ncbi:hypothetical protein [Streptomyces sp. IBSBF 2390]|uniref:hypothetical protein n=1 Tax=Streptomyces sp. IBSBF 2390 TaxID=2903533 RepID=UPI002FDBDB15
MTGVDQARQGHLFRLCEGHGADPADAVGSGDLAHRVDPPGVQQHRICQDAGIGVDLTQADQLRGRSAELVLQLPGGVVGIGQALRSGGAKDLPVPGAGGVLEPLGENHAVRQQREYGHLMLRPRGEQTQPTRMLPIRQDHRVLEDQPILVTVKDLPFDHRPAHDADRAVVVRGEEPPRLGVAQVRVGGLRSVVHQVTDFGRQGEQRAAQGHGADHAKASHMSWHRANGTGAAPNGWCPKARVAAGEVGAWRELTSSAPYGWSAAGVHLSRRACGPRGRSGRKDAVWREDRGVQPCCASRRADFAMPARRSSTRIPLWKSGLVALPTLLATARTPDIAVGRLHPRRRSAHLSPASSRPAE